MLSVRQFPLDPERRQAVISHLSRLAGQPVTVAAEQGLGHDWAPTTRLQLAEEIAGIGTSVVIKTRRTDGAGHGGPAHMRREAAGLRTAAGSGVTPALLGFDGVGGWVLQADAGDAPTLQDALLGTDPAAATAGMVALGTAVGRLHAHTRIPSFGRVDPAVDLTSGLVYADVLPQWSEVGEACDALGLPAIDPATTAVEALAERIGADISTAVLVHRDLNPGNVVLGPDGAYLIDFEGCWPGSPGVDSAFLAYPFPHHSSPWGVVPPAVSAAALEAYRAALATHGASELAELHPALLADGAATTLIWRLCRLSVVDRDDQDPGLRWRRRGQILNQGATFGRLAAGIDELAPFAEWLSMVLATLEERWPDEAGREPPLFPAFAHGH